MKTILNSLNGFSSIAVILIALGIIAVGSGIYFLASPTQPTQPTQQITNAPEESAGNMYPIITPSIQEGNIATPTNSQPTPVTASDLCVAEKDKIMALVNTFENFQMERDARSVLALFTSAELPDDISTYVYLSGSDAAGPRLYNSGQTNFNQPSFDVLEGPNKNASGGCTVKVQEQRSYYPEGVGGDFGPARPYTVYFVTVKQNDSWKIDRYLSDSGSTHKYSGWGY